MNKTKLNKILQLFQAKPDDVPKGWYTVIELSKILGKGRNTVTRMMRMQSEAKNCKIKTKQFNIKTKSGTRPIPHYYFDL